MRESLIWRVRVWNKIKENNLNHTLREGADDSVVAGSLDDVNALRLLPPIWSFIGHRVSTRKYFPYAELGIDSEDLNCAWSCPALPAAERKEFNTSVLVGPVRPIMQVWHAATRSCTQYHTTSRSTTQSLRITTHNTQYHTASRSTSNTCSQYIRRYTTSCTNTPLKRGCGL